ncbi:MAG: hypothetical protein MZU97_19790 [Bacillus subtilis]|nr:hypothetical protein [Bacillus subtilis]
MSMVNVAMSFKSGANIVTGAHGFGKPCVRIRFFKFSTIAFLTIAWLSDIENNVDFMDFPLTGNCRVDGDELAQGKEAVRSNS